MNARTVNKVWTGIFYAVAALVVALLVFLVFEILQKGWGFWDPNFLFGEPSNTRAVGGILGLIISGTPVDVNSLIGALMLIGIVVTNAIVLIERVQQNREHGMETREALLEAGSTRLRPIIMTAITTIVAMLPLLFSQSQAGSMVSKSLAVVVIGGLAVSTVLTLVVVPVMYELLDKIGRKRRSRRKISTSTETPDI